MIAFHARKQGIFDGLMALVRSVWLALRKHCSTTELSRQKCAAQKVMAALSASRKTSGRPSVSILMKRINVKPDSIREAPSGACVAGVLKFTTNGASAHGSKWPGTTLGPFSFRCVGSRTRRGRRFLHHPDPEDGHRLSTGPVDLSSSLNQDLAQLLCSNRQNGRKCRMTVQGPPLPKM